MLPALAWIAWREARADAPRQASARLPRCALAASGFGAYCFYIYQLTGNPLEWAATIQRWEYCAGRRTVDGRRAAR